MPEKLAGQSYQEDLKTNKLGKLEKYILKFVGGSKEKVNIHKISEKSRSVARSTITYRVQDLKEKDLLETGKGTGLHLTDKGLEALQR